MPADTKDRSELEPLFTPPADLHGTHLLMCGLSADTETLERALAAFTNEAPAQRRSSGLVRGWLMLDASAPQAGAQPVPGLLRLSPCLKHAWRARTTLMHAKVALMGFGASRCAAPRHWRLLVSTGNWTAPTWAGDGQIDLFWMTEWNVEMPPQGEAAQALADMHAAFAFFERLLEGLYGEHWRALRDEPLAGQWLATWRQLLRPKGAARTCTPQFIHSLDASLLDQISQRFRAEGVSQFVVGSGFFEQPDDGVVGPPEVLQALERLCRPATKRFLVFNPAQAGALASWFASLQANAVSARRLNAGQAGPWTLRLPRDPLLAKARGGRDGLHAKYIAGLHAVRNSGSARLAFLYLGSGNVSRRGLRSRAFLNTRGANGQRETGNVEAGVVLLPNHRVDRIWQRLACGEVASPAAITRAAVGTGRELFEPLDPPPLLFLREHAERLELVRSALPAATLWLQHEDGLWQQAAAHEEAVVWNAPCPPSVRVRASDPATVGTATEWEVPVMTRDGLFCRRELQPLDVDGVLQALLAFPAIPPQDEDEEDGILRPGGGRRPTSPTRYPLRVLAALVEVIGHRNTLVTLEEFPYWLTQLRLLLLEQADDTQRLAIRALGVDLFGALHEPGFVPRWLQAHPQLLERYEHLVHALRAAWCLPRGG